MEELKTHDDIINDEIEQEHREALRFFIPELWKEKLNNMLSKTLVSVCTNKNYEGEIKNQGDKVKLPDNQDLIVEQKKFFAFKVLDMFTTQTNESMLEAHLMNARKAITEVEETYLLSKHNTVDVKNIIGSELEPVELTKENIYQHFAQLAVTLKYHNASSTSRPWVIINPWIESYLLQSTEFIGANNVADKALREGAIGRIAGMDILVSPNLRVVDDRCYVLAGTNDAITFASQLAKIESLRDRDSFSDLIRGLYLYGVKTVKPSALGKIIVKV